MDKEMVKNYYQQIADVDIATIARELIGGRITSEQGGIMLCDCPHHASDTHRSLHVDSTKQKWFCFGCGVGGDVLHFVEFIQFGGITKGANGTMPESHKHARDYLAQKCGLPPLSSYGLSADSLSELERGHLFNGKVLDCLTEGARWYHDRLVENQEIYDWFVAKYRLSAHIIESQRIGYANNAGMLKHLASLGYSDDEIAGTGLYFYDNQDQLLARFHNRITFPYWIAGGRVDYMIARRTPWTEDKPSEQAKYKKLATHDEHQNRRVAPVINNSHLHNEHVLLSQSDYVVFTEGITDNLSAIDNGLPAISPVTVSVRNADWPRLIPKLSHVKTAYVVGDNEVSQAGLEGSVKIATILRKQGIEGRIIILPLTDAQREARKVVAERWGITDAMNAREVSEKKKTLQEADRSEYDALCRAAKADLNSYFADGHTRTQFDRLMADAIAPIDLAISRLDAMSDDLPSDLDLIFQGISDATAMEQTRIAKAIKGKIGKDAGLSLADIRARMKEVKTEEKSRRKATLRRERFKVTAAPGTCRNVIETKLRELAADTDSKDTLYAGAAEAAFDWFVDHGAKFFRTTAGDPFMLWSNKIYWMRSQDSGKKSLYGSMIYDYTGLTSSSTTGRTFLEVLGHLAVKHGEIRDKFSWLHTDIESHTIWFNLANDAHEIAKISPEGVTVIPNGGNEDGIFLIESDKMQPVQFTENVDESTALAMLHKLFMTHLACANDGQMLIFLWMSCFLLLDFASSAHPMARFEGPAGSGKSTAAKLISMLILGDEHQKVSTVAANFADSERSPLVLLDNIEPAQMTEDLTNFFLTVVSGVTREKRAQGTDSGVVQERPKCLMCSTGIAPLAGEFSEMTGRTFVVNFDPQTQSPDFLEGEAKALLRKHRDYLLSWIMLKTSKVLALLKQDAQRKIKRLLSEKFPGHTQRRCNEFLALMYAFAHVDLNADEFAVPTWLDHLTTDFIYVVGKMGELSKRMSRESNPIVACLSTLFDLYERARSTSDFSEAAVREVEDKYLLHFSSDGCLDVQLWVLHRALSNIAYQYRLPWPHKTGRQFSQRLRNDLGIVEDAGFRIEWKETKGRYQYLAIQRLDERADEECDEFV